MKALTERQPVPSLVAAGVVTILTRSWSTRHRGPLAIHAGKHRPGRGELGGWCFDDRPWLDDCGWIAPIMERDGYTGEPVPEFFGNKMSLGAVVATCTLADVVPIVGEGERVAAPWTPHVSMSRGVLRHWRGENEYAPTPRWDVVSIDDQLPFGDFTPGRYAWLLTDITQCDPIPVKGRPGLWEWTP